MKNSDRIAKSLGFFYYLAYVVLITAILLAHLLPLPVEATADAKYAVDIIVILVTLLSVPVTLKLFSVKTRDFRSMEYYMRWSRIQIGALAIAALLAALAYYFLRDKTSLYCYFIIFVAMIFTKPTKLKVEIYAEKEKEAEYAAYDNPPAGKEAEAKEEPQEGQPAEEKVEQAPAEGSGDVPAEEDGGAKNDEAPGKD